MTTRPLQTALAANLVFSTGCALALLFQGPIIGQALGAFPAWFMPALGLGLLGFAAFLLIVLRRLRIGWALVISGLDLLWVVSTLPLIAIPGLLTPQGTLTVACVAAIVGLLGVLQLRGIRTILADGDGGAGSYRHCVRLYSGADPEALWRTIRDLGAISRYSAGLSASRLEDGPEAVPGAVRVCTDQRGQSWAEEITALDDSARKVELRSAPRPVISRFRLRR